MHRDVVTAEAPRPVVRPRRAEDAQVVAARIAAALVAERDAPPLQLVEHVLQADDGRGGHVAGAAKAGGEQAHGQLLLRRTHLREGQAAVIRGCVVPALPLVVRREVPVRDAPLLGRERVDQRLRHLGHARSQLSQSVHAPGALKAVAVLEDPFPGMS
jgi:hypothetical protein